MNPDIQYLFNLTKSSLKELKHLQNKVNNIGKTKRKTLKKRNVKKNKTQKKTRIII